MTEHVEPDATLSEERAHRRRLARSTAIFGAATAVSRALGLVREIIAAYAFGAAGRVNAFTVAFQIPNLVRALVADTALSGAFVPVFSELLEKGERARAWRVASTIFWLVLLFTTALTAVFVLIAPLVVELFGTPGGDFDLASRGVKPFETIERSRKCFGSSMLIIEPKNSFISCGRSPMFDPCPEQNSFAFRLTCQMSSWRVTAQYPGPTGKGRSGISRSA
jgi:hypothetical protein